MRIFLATACLSVGVWLMNPAQYPVAYAFGVVLVMVAGVLAWEALK